MGFPRKIVWFFVKSAVQSVYGLYRRKHTSRNKGPSTCGQSTPTCSQSKQTCCSGSSLTSPDRRVHTTPDHHAHARRELQAAGFGEICLPGPPAGDLPPGIHPILAPENWIREDFNGNSYLWDEIEPALRLVTRFLTEDSALGWWMHMLHGKIEVDRETGRDYLEYQWGLHKSNEEMYRIVRQTIIGLQGKIKFVFADFDESINSMMSCSMVSIDSYSDSLRCYEPWYLPSWHMNSTAFIGINSSFAGYFLLGNRTPCQDVRTRWYLAVTLLHEIAHAAWTLLREDKSTGLEKNEPCFDITQTYMCGELGWALETHLFGGYVVSARSSARLGSSNFEFRPADADHSLAFPISPEWFYGFFTSAKWQMIRRSIDPKEYFRVPKGSLCFYPTWHRYVKTLEGLELTSNSELQWALSQYPLALDDSSKQLSRAT